MGAKTKRIGRHELRFEEPDLVHVRVVGDIGEHEVDEIFMELCSFGEGRPPQLWLMEMADAGSMNAASRRRSAYWMQRVQVGGVALIHLGFEQRIITQMLRHVFRLFTGVSYTLEIFHDGASARAWLVSLRR